MLGQCTFRFSQLSIACTLRRCLDLSSIASLCHKPRANSETKPLLGVLCNEPTQLHMERCNNCNSVVSPSSYTTFIHTLCVLQARQYWDVENTTFVKDGVDCRHVDCAIRPSWPHTVPFDWWNRKQLAIVRIRREVRPVRPRDCHLRVENKRQPNTRLFVKLYSIAPRDS